MHPAAGPVAAALVLAADQATKHVALLRLDPAAPLEVTPFFNLVLVWNRGVSFGLLDGAGRASPWLMIALAGVISLFVAVWLWRERRPLPRLALWLVLAGAVGNIIDRLRFGAVVDFLDFHLRGWHWPAFNVADSAIVVGAALLLLDSLFGQAEATNNARGERDARGA